MAGQPQAGGVLTFNVSNLEVSAGGGSLWDPQMIVELHETVNLGASFTGSGIIWTWLKNVGVQFNVAYFAEGMGVGAPEKDLGIKAGNLTPAVNVYGPSTVPDTNLTFTPSAKGLTPGVYRITCVVTFTGCPGLTGFFDGLMIEVYQG